MFGVYKGAGEAGRTYNNKTLVHNWWEDRLMPQPSSGNSGPDIMTSTSNRVFAADLAATSLGAADSSELATTTKRRTEAALQEAIRVEQAAAAAATGQERAKVAGQGGRGPSMFSGKHSPNERMQAYGKPDGVAYTMPPSVGHEAEATNAYVRLFDGMTTNKVCYEADPAAARGSPPLPGYYDVGGDSGRKHFKNSTLEKEKAAMSSTGVGFGTAELTSKMGGGSGGGGGYTGTVGLLPPGASAGRGGSMGELTRNPKEAGNPYGVSVFVDEYAQWQTKLAGMPLSETVSRAKTKYF